MNSSYLNNEVIQFQNVNGVGIFKFKVFEKYSNILKHCFSTRIGGVSTDACQSLNLGFKKRDLRENVIENFKRICKTIDVDYERLVLSDQVHGKKIKAVNTEDIGKGISKPSDIKGYDGLMTDQTGIPIVTFYADCVPVLFLDPVKRVIASSHSGWAGTLQEIAYYTVLEMKKTYNCDPTDILACIGPSIGKCCFEVGKDVYEKFQSALLWSLDYSVYIGNDKWHFDLQAIIIKSLLNSGLSEKNIFNAGICTKCNNDIFFSYRGDKGKTGSLAAIMQLV